MKITQIRNATVKIEYAGKIFLTDPWLVEKGGLGTFREFSFYCIDPAHETIPMPICDLPFAVDDVLSGVDALILTHVHPDHIDMEKDGAIGHMLPKQLPVFVDDVEDAHILLKSGFTDITVLYSNSAYGDVSLAKTPCHHGSKIPMCHACGVVFSAPGEKTLYIAGDTIWYDGVREALLKYKPDVVIVNACAATLKIYGRLIMNADDIARVHETLPQAKIVASHMDNVAHATLGRQDIREFIERNNLSDSVLVPDDGETLSF